MSSEEDQKRHINRIISAIRDESVDGEPTGYGDDAGRGADSVDGGAPQLEVGDRNEDVEYYVDDEERRQWDYAESQAPVTEPEYTRDEYRRSGSSKPQATSSGIASWLMDWRLIAALAILLAGLYMVNLSGGREQPEGKMITPDGGQGMEQFAALEQRITALERRLQTAAGDGEPLSVMPSGDLVSQEELQILRDQVNAGLQAQENTARAELKELEDRLGKTIDTRIAAARQSAPVATVQTPASAQSRPAPAATSTSSSWFVNVATYSQQSTAASLVESLQDSGRSAAIIPTTLGGEPSYRVRVINLSSRDAAQAAARELESQLGLRGLWVGQE